MEVVDGFLPIGCFHVLAIVNSAAMNIGVHVSFSILVSLGYIPWSGIAGSYGGFIPSFLRNLHTVFQRGCVSQYILKEHPLWALQCHTDLLLPETCAGQGLTH